MSEKKYSEKHEWVELNGDVATVGITKHATEQLGDMDETKKQFEAAGFKKVTVQQVQFPESGVFGNCVIAFK